MHLREALEGRRRVLGDDHPNTLASINHMAGLHREQGKLTPKQAYNNGRFRNGAGRRL
ncbi:MAG: tetratricopeptide repeat protein, partial [Phycisphaerae bacterium]